MIERTHRVIKSAIMCRSSLNWVYELPTVLLGMHAVVKEDLETIRLPNNNSSQHDIYILISSVLPNIFLNIYILYQNRLRLEGGYMW